LTPDDGEAIAVAAARMVEGLNLNDIVVMDNNLNVLFRDGEPFAAGAGMTNNLFFEMHIRDQMMTSAREVLGPAFNEVSVAANPSIDWRSVDTFEREFTSPLGEESRDGLTDWEEEIRRQAIANDGGPIGEPGIGPQGLDPPGYVWPDGAGPGSALVFDNETRRNHLHNMLETIMTTGTVPGVLMMEDSSVAITATNHILHNEADVRALGLLDDMSWLEYQNQFGTVGTTGIAGSATEIFEHPNYETLVALVQSATGVTNVSLMTMNMHHFVDEEVAPLPLDLIIIFSLILLFVGLMAFALIRRTAPEVVEEIEPELSVEDLLVSSQLEEAREAEMDRLAEIKYAGDSNVKEQIDKFAKEKPESVAQLLRNWINEDWE
jgi:flagellar M-ring protein FliF